MSEIEEERESCSAEGEQRNTTEREENRLLELLGSCQNGVVLHVQNDVVLLS